MSQEALQALQRQIEWQQNKLLTVARKIIPYVTPEDILQLIDYPQLEEHPEVRYLEGVLHGLQEAEACLRGATASSASNSP